MSALTQDLEDLKISASSPAGVGDFSITSGSLENALILNNKSIESSSYIGGVSGWKIDGSGVAEFSDVFVRGDINAYSGTIGYWNISNPDVVRRIGNRDLYGTFLESSDLGASDYNKDSGTYVGLYKSYVDEEVAIVSAYRTENVVTAVSPGHRFRVADLISVNIVDDVTMSTGESSVRVIEAGFNSFKYISNGPDVTEFTGENYSGTAILNNKDVAGLYLQDYGKALFDYGYFSNEGVAYVSAETPNFVYNSSFEYEDTGINFSASSWLSSGSTVTSYNYSASDIYNGDSTLGGQIGWTTTALSTYLHAKINEAEFKRLDFYKNNRELYLNFDMFFKFPIAKVAIPTTSSFVTTSSSVITITCPGHGLATNDLVYFDFQVAATGYSNYTNSYRIHTVLSVSGDSFTVQNKLGTTTANPVTLSRRYTTSGPVIFKYVQPVLDLNDIKISFVTDNANPSAPVLDSTTSLYDVLTDVTIADWDDYQYWSHPAAEFETWYFGSDLYSSGAAYRPISSMGVTALDLLDGDGSTKQVLDLKLSSSKIESFYRKLALTSYNSNLEFYISFPQWIWEGTYSDGSTAPTKRTVKAISSASMGYILDNVSLSPSKKFFYGDSGSSSFYYKLEDGDTVKTNKVSYETPRRWIDIDLEFQTAQFKYIDSIEFKSSDFQKQLYLNSGINTVKSVRTVFGSGNNERFLVGESSTLNITSGQYKYLTEDNVTYRSVEAYSSLETGTASAIHAIRANSSVFNQQNPDGLSGGVLAVSVDSFDKGQVTGWADVVDFLSKDFVSLRSADALGDVSTLMVSPAGVSFDTSTSESYFEMNASGPRFRDSSSGGVLFGLTNDASPKITVQAALTNQLTSGYQTVYMSNSVGELGYVSSSIKTKKNVEPLSLSVASILEAEPVQFNYISEEDGSAKHAGFIAEQLVDAGLSGYVSFDVDGQPITVNYEKFVSALQLVARSQADEIEQLKARVSELEDK